MSAPRPPLSEDVLRRELASAAELIDPQPPTRAELQALARRRHRVLRTAAPPLLVAAAVAAIAAVSVAVVSHSSQPRPPATTGPRPTPTVSSTPPGPAPSTHPVVPPKPSVKHSKPSTSSSESASTHSSSTPPPAGLVPGPYGFLVPQGWNVHPLVSGGGGTTHWGSATRGPDADYATAAPFTAEYISGWLSGGRGVGLPYTSGHQPNLSIAASGTLCSAVDWQPISSNAISFTCAPVSGQVPRGVLIVEPYPNGTKQVVVTLPTDQRSTATQILDSFR